MIEKPIPTATQESLLTALCLLDDEHGARLAELLTAADFSGPNQVVASRAPEFRKKYGQPPGREHLDDLLGAELESDQRGETYRRLLQGMFEQQAGLNGQFLLAHVTEFLARRAVAEFEKHIGAGISKELIEGMRKAVALHDSIEARGANGKDHELLGAVTG